MASTTDPLPALAGGALRVAYATGRMLNTEDFSDEQLYHRGRLAHVLSWLAGPGTMNGLNVAETTTADGTKELVISPGMALDRAGRIIDVQFPLCIRLKAWLDAQSTSDLSDAFKTASKTIVADLFLGFQQNPQGKTPSFAAGDYDATDAYTADRWLDSFSAQLYLRPEAVPPLPADTWQALSAPVTLASIQQAILNGQSGAAMPAVEYPAAAGDKTAVFLARIGIGATRASAGDRPAYDLTTAAVIDYTSRPFVYPIPALVKMLPAK